MHKSTSRTTVFQSMPPPIASQPASQAERVMELYLEQLEAGQCPDRATFLSEYPDIAEELSGQLEALEFLHFTAPQLAEAKDLTAEQGLSDRATLGDFQLIKQIGRGGMGIVYEAEQLSLGRRVAVKVLPFAAMLDPRQLKRFHNEARAAATLEHPHIVPIYFVGQERGVHFYAMQLIAGQSLAEVVRDMRASSVGAELLVDANRRLSDSKEEFKPAKGVEIEKTASVEKQVVQLFTEKNTGCGVFALSGSLHDSAGRRELYRTIALLGAQAAEALQHAHEQGIIHRDIKPGNLMVDWSGKLWVTDFGLAQLDTNDPITAAGDLLGTLAYMSPEQLSPNAIADARSDIYSLGATLYELLTGERPFCRRGAVSKSPVVATNEVPSLNRFDRNIPLDLQTIVHKAMASVPVDRYLTARAMADDLRCFVAGTAIRARPISRFERAMRWAQRHPQWVAALGLACIILLAILGVSTTLVLKANLTSRGLLTSVREHADQVEELLYFSDMQLAYQAWETRKPGRARSILRQQVPADENANDLRGIEWHLLNSLTDAPEYMLLGEHLGPANQLAVFPDGKRVASVGDDQQLRIWDLETGATLAAISMGESSIEALFAVAVSPDGATIATGSDVVQLWDVKSQKVIRKLTSFDYNVQSIAFAPNGQQIAVGTRYDRVRLLDLEGNVLGEIEDESRHESLAFTPDGRELLIPTRPKSPQLRDGFVSVWRSDLSEVRAQFPAEDAEISPSYTLASVSPDGTFFVLCPRYFDKPPCIVDAHTEEILLSLREKHDEVNAMDISPDGKLLAVAFNDGTIECSPLKRTDAGKFSLPDTTKTLNAHHGKVNSIKFASPNQLVSCGADGQVKLWRLTDESPGAIGIPETYALDITSSNEEIVFANEHGLHLYNTEDGSLRGPSRPAYASGAQIAVSADSLYVAGTSQENRVVIYRRSNIEILQQLVFDHRPSDLSFSPVVSQLAVISGNGILSVWNLETMTSIAELVVNPTLTGAQAKCSYTVDGKFILAGGTFGELVVVDASSYTIQRHIPLPSNTNDIAFSPQGDVFATAHDDGGIRVWDWPSGVIRTTLIGHTQKVERIAFSSNGLTLASCSLDNTTRLWAPKDGRYYGVLKHHASCPTDLAFAPNDAFLTVTQTKTNSTDGGLLIFPTNVEHRQ